MTYLKPAEGYEHLDPGEDVRALLEAARALVAQARASCWFTLDSSDDYDTRRVICDGRNALTQAEDGLCVAIQSFDCLEMSVNSEIDARIKLKAGVL